jgi:hypothetical protein
MPIVRRLTAQEVQSLERKGKGQRRLVEEQYDAFLADYGPGDYGEAELDEDENRLTVRNRFKAAAARRGLSLIFPRTNGNLLRFQVVSGLEPAEVAVEPERPSTPQTAPKGRGGRRRAAVVR